MNDGQPRLPSDRYWNTVLEGYQDVGFDRALLDEARRECSRTTARNTTKTFVRERLDLSAFLLI